MNRLYAVPLGAVLVAAVTAAERLQSLHHVRADPCALLVTYLAFRFDVVGGAVSALVLGAVLDLAAGAPIGLHMMSLALLFVVLRAAANAIQLEPGLRLLPVALGGAVMHAFLVGVMVEAFGSGTLRLAGVWQSSLPSVLANGVVGLVALALVDKAARRFHPEPDHMFLP